MGVYRAEAEWAEIVNEYKKSGQTYNEFSRSAGVSAKTLSKYVRGMAIGRDAPAQRSEEEWTEMIARQQASGISRMAWCRENGVNASSMDSAERRMLKKKAQKKERREWIELAGVTGAPPPNHPPASDGGNAPNHEAPGIRIRSGSISIELNESYPLDKLTALIGKLVGGC